MMFQRLKDLASPGRDVVAKFTIQMVFRGERRIENPHGILPISPTDRFGLSVPLKQILIDRKPDPNPTRAEHLVLSLGAPIGDGGKVGACFQFLGGEQHPSREEIMILLGRLLGEKGKDLLALLDSSHSPRKRTLADRLFGTPPPDPWKPDPIFPLVSLDLVEETIENALKFLNDPPRLFIGGAETQAWILDRDATLNDIRDTRNVETRRTLIDLFGGYERFVKEGKFEEIGADEFGVLLETKYFRSTGDFLMNGQPLELKETIRVVHVTCPSTGREYFLRVPPETTTPHEAVAWTFGKTADTYYPQFQT